MRLAKLRAKVEAMGGKDQVAKTMKAALSGAETKAKAEAMIASLADAVGVTQDEVMAELGLKRKASPVPRAKPAVKPEGKALEDAGTFEDMDPSSPNYRYRDIGHVGGSRKEKAAEMLRTAKRDGTLVIKNDIDWESIELTKSDADEHYIWAIVTDARGPRIWSQRVIESDAMTNPDTGERRILMGDFIRGTTLYDRHDVRLAVGFVDDDFARNLRTLRAEERIALAVKRPFAFEWFQTGAPYS
jgi:hypothetical protein